MPASPATAAHTSLTADTSLTAHTSLTARAGWVIRPAPPREPPFDDELPARHLSVVGPLDQRLPFAVEPVAPVRPIRGLGAGRPGTLDAGEHTQLPDAHETSRRLVIGVIEVATGRRPASQLATMTSPAVQAGLVRDAGRVTRLGTSNRPAVVHSIHLHDIDAGVAEVAVVVRLGARFRAIALRLEGVGDAWRCVRLQIG